MDDMTTDMIEKKLNWFISRAQQMELNDTKSAAELVLKRYKTKKLDEGIVNDFGTIFEIEFSQQDSSYEKSFKIIKKIWNKAIEKRKSTGKLIDPYPVDRTRINQLEKNLGIIYDEALSEKESNRRFMLLLCLGHIVRKEAWFKYFNDWFTKIGNIGSFKKESKDFLKEYFTIRYKDDISNIRNSIAHGNFKFLDDHFIEFRSYDRNGKEIFKIKLTDGDLIELNNIFKKKVRFLDLFIEFEVIMKLIADHLYKK